MVFRVLQYIKKTMDPNPYPKEIYLLFEYSRTAKFDKNIFFYLEMLVQMNYRLSC